MLKFFNSSMGKIEEISSLCDGAWVSVVNPTQEEREFLLNEMGLDSGFVISSLDEEETPRIEVEDEQTLIILDVPTMAINDQGAQAYSTVPMGIIFTQRNIVTISIHKNRILEDLESGVVKNISTAARMRFFLNICLRAAMYYNQYLRAIDKVSIRIEKQLHLSMRNEELFQMMTLTKSLVYFSTSIKSDQLTLEKLRRGRAIKLLEEDEELLEDVLIEFEQAMDMSVIHKDVLAGMMDAFASIISNNLNVVMKVLTSLTILLAIPTVVSSFYGMNVGSIPFAQNFWLPVAIAAFACIIAAVMLSKKGMLK